MNKNYLNYKLAMVEKKQKRLAAANDDIGDIYYFGWGIESNHEEALKWYTKAAEQGSYEAKNMLTIINNFNNSKGF